MKNPSDKIRRKRKDLSPYLFHFTQDTANGDAFSNLSCILNEQKLRSSRGYICFTDTPITEMIPLLDYRKLMSKPILSKYGIGFNRDLLIKDYGARPVIYGDNDELKLIPDIFRWRSLVLDVERYDYSWLREWRIKGELDFSSIDPNEIVVIAPDTEEVKSLICDYKVNEVLYDAKGKFIDADIEEMFALKGFSLDKLIQILQTHEASDFRIKDILDKIPLNKPLNY